MQKQSRKFEAGHEKSRVGLISFTIIVLKTTIMYFDLSSLFSPAVLSKKPRCFLPRNVREKMQIMK